MLVYTQSRKCFSTTVVRKNRNEQNCNTTSQYVSSKFTSHSIWECRRSNILNKNKKMMKLLLNKKTNITIAGNATLDIISLINNGKKTYLKKKKSRKLLVTLKFKNCSKYYESKGSLSNTKQQDVT